MYTKEKFMNNVGKQELQLEWTIVKGRRVSCCYLFTANREKKEIVVEGKQKRLSEQQKGGGANSYSYNDDTYIHRLNAHEHICCTYLHMYISIFQLKYLCL